MEHNWGNKIDPTVSDFAITVVLQSFFFLSFVPVIKDISTVV